MGMTEELVNWTHEQKCQKAVESLGKNGFEALFCSSPQEAFEYIMREAADAHSIGFGGSMTVAGLGVEAHLREQGKEILNHGTPGLTPEQRLEINRRQLTCDLFLSGCNALTLSGELVNIDATGNRAAAMFFGPRKVIVVAGRNKLVAGTSQEAIDRIKDRATPPNAKRLSFNTPCARTGFCSNCNSPERLCRVTTIIDRRPRFSDVRVLVVNADLGF
ncbi:lactate utilization protein [Geobacter sp. SVR]|uniref:lactate utilization protein n=1 Tax=Geobacter sp. SVR TaxID=2495594 RepID=UPI00143EF5B6|nr:lactate utilization protein [Geobacter sp. SVR]BCS55148.1 lactate utilization protein C [Geobacter sp. SVR]GCF85329.1 lactate utilization protein C [Geobacter sp. SVR]